MYSRLITIASFCLMVATGAQAGPGHDRNHGHHECRGHGQGARAPARAQHRAPATVVVDNRWNHPVMAVVDGRVLGRIGGRDSRNFRVRSGRSTVQIQTLDGFVLSTEDHHLRPRQSAFVEVRRPTTHVRIANTGHRPLLVETGGRRPKSVWIQPGERGRLRAKAGTVRLTAMVQTRRGDLRVVDEQSVVAMPGQRNRARMAFTPRTRDDYRGRQVSYVRR